MSDIIVMRFEESDAESVSWIRMTAEGKQLSGVSNNSLAEIATQVEDHRVIVLLPSTEVSQVRVHIPVRSKSKMLQAVPFAMEEHLTDDVDDLHFAIGKRDTGGKVDVAVVRKVAMDTLTRRLADAGINPSSILADSCGVPGAPGNCTVLLDEDRIFSRDEAGNCVVLDAGSFEEVAAFMDWYREPEKVGGNDDDEDEESEAPGTNLEVYVTEDRYDRDKAFIESLHVLVKSLEIRLLRDGPLALLASHAIGQGGINLRQGKYAPSTNLLVLWQPWRVAASLLLAFILIGFGTKATEIFHLKRQEAAIRQAQITLLQSTFPDIGNVTDPLRQMRSRIGSNSDAPAENTFFLETLYTIGKAVSASGASEIESVSFGNKVMDIRLHVPNVETLDRIQQQIADNEAIEARIQSANQREDGFEGRLQIEWTGA